tara:strand:- start:478 stop:642 length:165 start_codon:yes stop_codon:yes gene_type:complete
MADKKNKNVKKDLKELGQLIEQSNFPVKKSGDKNENSKVHRLRNIQNPKRQSDD